MKVIKVLILKTFKAENGKTWTKGLQPDLPVAIAKKAVADGLAQYVGAEAVKATKEKDERIAALEAELAAMKAAAKADKKADKNAKADEAAAKAE